MADTARPLPKMKSISKCRRCTTYHHPYLTKNANNAGHMPPLTHHLLVTPNEALLRKILRDACYEVTEAPQDAIFYRRLNPAYIDVNMLLTFDSRLFRTARDFVDQAVTYTYA